MKRLSVLFLVIILILSIASGCASSTPKNAESGSSATTADGNKDYGGAQAGENSGNQAVVRKVIRDADLDLQARDVAAAYDEILAYAIARGGYEADRNQRKSGDNTYISAKIKIKPGELDGFLDFIADTCEVISMKASISDITEDYYDALTRLETMEKSLLTYYGFLDQAEDIEESLTVQREINQITEDIEALKGKIKVWDSLLAESTVTFEISPLVDPVKTRKEINWSTLTFSDMGYLMQAGLTGVLNFLVNILQWLAIALVVTLPLWLPALIIILTVRRSRRKRRLAQQKALLERQKAVLEQAAQAVPDQADDTGPQPADR